MKRPWGRGRVPAALALLGVAGVAGIVGVGVFGTRVLGTGDEATPSARNETTDEGPGAESPKTPTTPFPSPSPSPSSRASSGVEAPDADVPTPRPDVDFATAARDFLESRDEFARIAHVDAWVAARETRALDVLARQGARGGTYLRGAVLQALGRLGRTSSVDADRARAFDVLAARVDEAAARSDASTLGDGLIACEALVELGWRGDGQRLLDAMSRASTLGWPLAEGALLALEALGLPERAAAGALLARYLGEPPNAMFRAMPREDAQRLAALAARVAPR